MNQRAASTTQTGHLIGGLWLSLTKLSTAVLIARLTEGFFYQFKRYHELADQGAPSKSRINILCSTTRCIANTNMR